MNQIAEFFVKLFDSSDWPPRWHCGQWTAFHGWLYIVSDLLIWSAYFSIPIFILRFISKKQDIRFVRLYFLFAAFILACGATHLLDAIAFWVPLYRLNALVRFITGVISWVTVFYLIKYLPVLFSLKPQKALEEEIQLRKRSEEKFKGLLEAAPDAMVIANEKGEITLINRQTEKLFGYSKEELIGKPVEILIPPDFHNKHITDRTKYFADPKVRSMGVGLELFAVRKDGTQFPVEISLSPLITEEGTLISASVRDITERKKAEDKLKKAKKDFQLLVSSVKDYAIFMLDKNGYVASWNAGAENIKGYRAEEIIGQPLDVFYTPEEKKSGEPQRNLQMALKDGQYETEGLRVRKDGSTFFANIVFSSLIDDEGSLYGYAKVTRDITEKRKAEERLRFLASIADNIQDPVISTDNATGNNFIITRWNKPAEKLLEWKSEEVMGKNAMEIFKTAYPNDTREQIFELLKAKGFWQGEVIYHTKSGLPVHVLSTISYLKDAKGNITGNLVLIRDITKRKKVEDALSKLNEELEQKVIERTEKLAASEMHFRSLIEHSAEGITLTDEFSNVIYRSPGSQKITGILPIENVVTLSHPEDLETIKNKRREILKNPGVPIDFQGRFIHASGHYIWLEGTFTNLLHVKEVNAIVTNYRDITQRKEAEEKIAQTLKEKNTILESIGDAFFAVDKNWTVTYWNRIAEKDLAVLKQDIIGKNLWEIFSDSTDSESYRRYHQAIATGQVVHFEDYYAALNKWYEISAYPSENGLSVYFKDVTERKKAEEAILRAEANYREIFDKANDGIYVHETNTGKVINVNHRATEITGFSKEELMTGDPHNFMTDHPDYSFEKAFGHIQKAAGGEPQFFEWLGRCKDGSSSWFEMNLKRTNIGGHDRILAFQRDINDRKKVEEKLIKSEKIYKTIASSIPGTVICLLDTDYRYLLIEGEMLEKLGYSKAELLGNKAEDVLPPEVFAGVQEEFKRVLNGETITRETNRNGYDIIARLVPLKDENNIVYTIMAVSIDVTKLKNAQRDVIELNRGLEEKVLRRTEQLKRSVEEMEAFSYSVSHDLRAPLRGIIGFANILEEDYGSILDDEAKRITAVIKKNTSKMGQLIDDLLTFSRTGRQEVIKTSLDNDKIVRGIIDDFGLNNSKKIKWIIHPLPFITADINTINQVWINLISNAVKYSGNVKQPKIEIGSIKENDAITFFVKDNGVGFDEKYKAKLFKVFQRLHTSEEFEGTGIGLALVDKIIDKHGGKVWAEAALNKGATFYFSLPVDKDQITNED